MISGYEGVIPEILIIPEGTVAIAQKAFENNKEICVVQFPSSLRKINFAAFGGCENLCVISFSQDSEMVEISTSAFINCKKLTKLILPDNIKKIDCSAFKGCTHLEEVHLPNSVMFLGSSCFSGCERLKEVILPDSLEKMESSVFENCLALENVEFGAKLKIIPYSAFDGCALLEEIHISQGINKLEGECFRGCLSLKKVYLYGNSIHITPSAFDGCTSLIEVYTVCFSDKIFDGFIYSDTLKCIINMNNQNDIINVEEYRHRIEEELHSYSFFYKSLGMNLTLMRRKRNAPKNMFKEPDFSDWQGWLTKEQDLSDIIKWNWKDAIGCGLVLGYNRYRALDFDGVWANDMSSGQSWKLVGQYEGGLQGFIKTILRACNLPEDYPWVVLSGSGCGFHIIFKCDDFDTDIDTISLEPNDNFMHDHQCGIFDRVELRWADHLVLPPSYHASGLRYKFWKGTIPNCEPETLGLSNINNLLNTVSGNKVFNSYSYKDIVFELVKDSKIFCRHDSYLAPREYNEDSIAWLKTCSDSSSLNALAIEYVLGIKVVADAVKARELFEKANNNDSNFNIASLISCGYFPGNQQDVEMYLNKVNFELGNNNDEVIFSEEYRGNCYYEHSAKVYKNSRENLTKGKKYLFFDTETTGIPLDYNAPSFNLKNWPRLVQIAWITTSESGNIIGEKISSIIIPEGFYIPASATAIHGITQKKAEMGFDLVSVLSDFFKRVKECDIIIGHNISFDIHIVAAEMIRKNMINEARVLESKPTICTMKQTTEFCKIPDIFGYKYPKLQELYKILFGTNFSNAHDAFADIDATRKCYFELVKRGVFL